MLEALTEDSTLGSLSISTLASSVCSSQVGLGTTGQDTNDNTTNQLSIRIKPGSIASDCTSYTITTTNQYGYTLSINGPSNGQLTNTTNLQGNSIQSTSGTMTNPSTFSNQTSGGVWGFAIPIGQLYGTDNSNGADQGEDSNGTPGTLSINFDTTYNKLDSSNTTNNSKYARVPTTPTEFSKTTTATNPSTPDTYELYFAISAGSSIPTGAYTGEITISTTINLPPPVDIPLQPGDTIQQVGKENPTGGRYTCPTTPTNLRDERDNHYYAVNTLPDGKCWMLTNLAYGGNTTGIGDNYNPGTEFTTGAGQNTSTNVAASASNWNRTNPPYLNQKQWVNPTRSGVEGAQTSQAAFRTTASSINYAETGYYYNWCAALGNASASCAQTSGDVTNAGTGLWL